MPAINNAPNERGTLNFEKFLLYLDRDLHFIEGFSAAMPDENGKILRARLHSIRCNLKRISVQDNTTITE